MKYVLGLVVAVTVLGVVQASSEDAGCGAGVSAGTGVTVGLSRNNYPDGDRNTTVIKEGETESPEMIAVIERNREDRERTVVIDR